MSNINLEQVLEKRKQAQKILGELNIPAWVMIVADNKAENAHLPLIGAPLDDSSCVYVLTPNKAIVFTHNLGADTQREYGFETIEVKDRNVIMPLAKNLASIVGKGTPIALNYSKDFPQVDTLGFGTYKNFEEELVKNKYFSRIELMKNKYFLKKENTKFISADNLIFTLASTKLPYEIETLREAAKITDEILKETFKNIKPGMTEKQVSDIVHKIADFKIAVDKRLDYSWNRESNPIVLTGEGIGGSPHVPPSDRIVEKGSTVYLDFGISVNDYHGDLQHFGYVLKEGETNAPKHVQEVYNLLLDSIHAGMKAAVPGALGWHVDKASRDVITNANYPNYDHCTGHQLGAGGTHAPGMAFGPLFGDYTNEGSIEGRNDVVIHTQLPVKERYAMTIEPRIKIPNGASIEVDGIVTKKGFELFAPIQEKIHLVK